MVAISRVQVVFSGGAVVGPAASSFFTTGQVDDLRNPLITFWTAIKGAFPSTLTMTIPNTGETYDDVTGDLLNIWTEGTTFTQSGTSAASFARGVGARVVWDTAGVTNNRRVRGSTFLVPMASNNFSNDGTIDDGTLSDLRTAASALVVAAVTDFTIWTRPKGASPGKTSGVVGSTVPDKVSTLRSRRV